MIRHRTMKSMPSLKMAVLTLAVAFLFGAGPARGQIYTTLHTYPGTNRNNSGILPPGLMSQGQDGDLYGTITNGGSHSGGTAFKITPLGQLTTLYNFCSQTSCLDGNGPQGGLTLGTDGSLYGTTTGGGKNNTGVGTIFKITPTGTWTKLWDFTSLADGGYPTYAPFEVPDGNFYGVASEVYFGDYGLVYKLTPEVSPPDKLTVLGDFNYTDGYAPNLPTFATDGNFYGTTRAGGDPTCRCGVVYKMTPSGVLTVLHNFTGYPKDGYLPTATLVQGNDGDFYGTTYEGGADNVGTIFKISSSGSYTVLHSFTPSFTHIDGSLPIAGLALGTDGDFYGTTVKGGKNNLGTIYKITPSGSLTILHTFCSLSACADGFFPETPLIQHTDGKFYGNTSGNSNGGSVFYSLDLALRPFASLVPWQGKVGTTVEILGQGFTGTSSVSFAGTRATFTVVSDTYLTATVPNGAVTGAVNVVTPRGTLTSSHIFLVVPLEKTSTSVVSSVNPSVFDESVTFTATVKPATSGTPTGTVTFKDGTTVLGTGTLSGEKATFTTSALKIGTHSVTAAYAGDADFAGSTSAALSQIVNKATTSSTAVSSANPSVSGHSVTFTVTVKPATSGTPTGTVTFKDGTTVLGTGTLNGGKATFTTSALKVGMHSITAMYGGDANFAASTSAILTQTVH